MDRKPVAFRRVKGRIVPIYQKKSADGNPLKESATGAALIAGGSAVAALAGRAYKAITVKSTKMSFRSTKALQRLGSLPKKAGEQLPLFGFPKLNRGEKLALKLGNRAEMLGKFAVPARVGGQAAAAAIIGLGAAKLAQAVQREDNTAVTAAVGGAAAALAFRSKGASRFAFTAGMYPKAAAKDAFKRALPYLKKLSKAYR